MKKRIICCQFGKKFNDWHVENLKYMIDHHSGIEYDDFEVITNDIYGNWYNKLQMFDKFRYGENLYFDLDIIIYNKVPKLWRKPFTLLHDHWRITENTHTPLNSSIVSWTGDVSHIWDKFKSDDDFYLKKYYKGSDEFYYKEIDYETYGPDICYSIKGHEYEKLGNPNYSICTLGQMHHILEQGWTGWWSKYLLAKKF